MSALGHAAYAALGLADIVEGNHFKVGQLYWIGIKFAQSARCSAEGK
jgi:hypothetical protein